MQLNNDDYKLIELCMDASDAALYKALGEEYSDGTLGIGPSELMDNAKKAVEKVRKQCQKTLCDPEFIEKISELDKGDRKLAIIGILEVVVSCVGLPSAVYVSVLLFRISLNAWCSNYDHD